MPKWKRANDGFVKSHCGRWEITPLYCGSTRPQMFELWLDGKNIGGWFSTQKEAKEDAERQGCQPLAVDPITCPNSIPGSTVSSASNASAESNVTVMSRRRA